MEAETAQGLAHPLETKKILDHLSSFHNQRSDGIRDQSDIEGLFLKGQARRDTRLVPKRRRIYGIFDRDGKNFCSRSSPRPQKISPGVSNIDNITSFK